MLTWRVQIMTAATSGLLLLRMKRCTRLSLLSGGYLTFAESPVIPDLRTRLIRSRRLSPGQWNQVIANDQAHGGVGALLVSGAVVTRNELRDLLWSVALDTLIALTTPPSAEPPAASVRFWPRRSHWVGIS